MDRQIIFDTPKYYGRQLWCHMTSNDLELLHEVAQSIGLKREWFQDKPGHPHYDIKSSLKRKEAIALGAEMVSPKEYLLKVIEWHRKPDEFPNQNAIRPLNLNFYDNDEQEKLH